MQQVQEVHIQYYGDPSGFSYSSPIPYALTFQDPLFGTLTTTRIPDIRDASAVENALLGLPNHVVPGVTVELDENYETNDREVKLHITFSHTGSVPLIQCPSPYGCAEKGCHPKYSPVVKDMASIPYFTYSSDDDKYLSMDETAGLPNPDEWDMVVLLECQGGSFNCIYEAFPHGNNALGTNAFTSSAKSIDVGIGEVAMLPFGLRLTYTGTSYPPSGTHTYAFRWSFPRCTVVEERAASSVFEHVECGGRGLCDRGNGKCNCFSGYAGLACSQHIMLA